MLHRCVICVCVVHFWVLFDKPDMLLLLDEVKADLLHVLRGFERFAFISVDLNHDWSVQIVIDFVDFVHKALHEASHRCPLRFFRLLAQMLESVCFSELFDVLFILINWDFP